MEEDISFYLIDDHIVSSSAFPNFHNLGFRFGDVLTEKKALIKEQKRIDEQLKQEKH